MSKFSTFILSLMFFVSVAHAAPDTFVYEGVLEDTNGPITSSSTLVLRIYDSALNCLLYEETQSVVPDSNGAFSVRVGSAVSDVKRTGNDPQLSMSTVFLSSGTVRSSTTSCPGGYTAASSDSRRLVINVNGTDLSPAIEISSAPFALSASTADKVGSYTTSKLLRSDGATTVPALDDTKVTLLMSILSGSLGSSQTGSGEVASKGYVDNVAANLLSASTAFSGDVTGTSSALTVGKIKGIAVDMTGIATNKILKYDGTKWAMGDDNTGVNPGNASSSALGLMKAGTGLKDSGAGDGVISVDSGTAAGKIVQLDAAAKLPAVDGSALTNLSPANLSTAVSISKGGTGATTASGAFSALSPLTTKGDVLTFDGTNNVRIGVGTDGQVLTADSTQANGLKWTTISGSSGGTVTSVSGTAPISVSNGTSTPAISIAQATSTTAGYLSAADWNAFNLKQSSSLASGKIFVGNAGGGAAAVDMAGDATISNAGVVTVTKTQSAVADTILQLSSNGGAKVRNIALYNGTNVVTLAPPTTGGNYSLTFPSNSPTASQMLQSDAAGNLVWVTPNTLPTGTVIDNYLKWTGTNWTEASVNVTTIKGALGTQQFPTNCTANQTMVWNSPTDAFMCADTNAATVSTMDKTIYVNASGSDTACNGTAAATAASAPNCAFQTLQKAVDSTPDFIRHKITIEVGSNLTSQGNDRAIAVINKNIAAQSIANGPFLIIQGSTGSEVLSQGAFTNGIGIVVGPAASGVYIKKISINDFQDTGIRIDGGLAVIDDTNFNNNRSALSVSSAGRAMLGANININLSNTAGTDGSRGIEVYHGSVSSEAAMNINLGSAQNNRGIGIEYGDVSIEEQATVSGSGSQYQTGVEVGNSGSLSVATNYTLRVNMGNNYNSNAVRVSNGGHLSVDGTLQLESISNQALTCENNAVCDFYGIFYVLNGTSSNGYVTVKNGSILNAQSDFRVEGSVSGTSSASIQVSDNSIFKFSPTTPSHVLRAYGSSGATGIRVTNNSQFKVETAYTYTLDFSGVTTLLEATNMSTAIFAANAMSSGGGYSYPIRMDDSSRVTVPSGYSFQMPYKICPAGMMPVGSGDAGFCIDGSNTTQSMYYNALNTCSGRGLKLCSKQQYALYCASGNTISPAVWTAGIENLTCNSSSLSAAADTISMNYYFRCCQ